MPDLTMKNGTPMYRELTEAEVAALSEEEIGAIIDEFEDEGEPWTEETLRAAIMEGIASAEAGHIRVFNKQTVEDILARAEADYPKALTCNSHSE